LCLDPRTHHDRSTGQGGHTVPIQITDDRSPMFGLTQPIKVHMHQLLDLRDAFPMGDADCRDAEGEALHEVGDGVHGTERVQMIDAGKVAPFDRADGQPLHDSGNPINLHDLPSVMAFSTWMKAPVMMS
jgi:hypothetical protein